MRDTTIITITITTLGRGLYAAHHAGHGLLAASSQPFLDGCRVLLAEGWPPDTPVAMAHAGSPHIALRSTVGKAAALTVSEAHGTRFERWGAFSSFAVAPLVRPAPTRHPPQPPSLLARSVTKFRRWRHQSRPSHPHRSRLGALEPPPRSAASSCRRCP